MLIGFSHQSLRCYCKIPITRLDLNFKRDQIFASYFACVVWMHTTVMFSLEFELLLSNRADPNVRSPYLDDGSVQPPLINTLNC